jgi:hypothetical protein
MFCACPATVAASCQQGCAEHQNHAGCGLRNGQMAPAESALATLSRLGGACCNCQCCVVGDRRGRRSERGPQSAAPRVRFRGSS